jgi:hypothetical protein
VEHVISPWEFCINFVKCMFVSLLLKWRWFLGYLGYLKICEGAVSLETLYILDMHLIWLSMVRLHYEDGFWL